MDPDILAYQQWRGQQARPGATSLAYLAQGNHVPATAPKKEKRSSGIGSIALGTLGAVGGGFLGTLGLPGVGTVAGAAGVGAAGSAAGEALEQFLTRGKVDAGDVVREGAIGAVGGPAGKAVSGVAKLAGRASGGSSLLQKMGSNLEGGARGIRPGKSVVGQEALGVEDAAQLNDFLTSVGVRGKNATTQLAEVEQLTKGWGKEIGDVVAQRNVKIPRTSLTTVKDDILADLSRMPDYNPADEVTTRIMANLGKVKDTKGLHEFQKGLDDIINYGRKSTTPDPYKERVAEAVRAGVHKTLTQNVPELAPTSQLYSQGKKAQDFLKGAAKNPKGVQLLGPFGGGNVGGNAIQAAGARTGSLLDRLGTGTSGGANLLGSLTTNTIGQVGARALLKPPTPPEAVDESLTPVMDETAAMDAQMPPQEESGDMMTPEVIQGLMAQALSAPDAKSQAAQLALVEKLIDIQGKLNPQQKKKPLTEAQNARQEALGLTEKAIQQLSSGSVNTGMIAGPLEDLKAKFSVGDKETVEFNRTASSLRAAIAKARSGSALTATEIGLLNKYVPKSGDSRQELESKLQGLYETLSLASMRDSGGAASQDVLREISGP